MPNAVAFLSKRNEMFHFIQHNTFAVFNVLMSLKLDKLLKSIATLS